jgi:drug/metabolite transporter (DMT)-like permease
VFVQLRGQGAVLASAVGFGVATALSVLALQGLRPADLLAVELGGSALVLVGVAAATDRFHRRGAARALAQGMLTPGLSFLLGDLGLARTTATSGSLLLGSEALLTVGLAVIVLRERLDATAATALTMGVGGTVLVSLGAGPLQAATAATMAGTPLVGNLLVLASVLCGSAFTVWSRKAANANDDTNGVGTTAWQFVGAAAAVTPFVSWSWLTAGSRLTTARPTELVAAAAVLGCGLAGLLAFNIGIGAVTASRAALLGSLQPVAGALTALAVLGEALRIVQAAGGVLIMLGLVVLTRDRPPRKRRTSTSGRATDTCCLPAVSACPDRAA